MAEVQTPATEQVGAQWGAMDPAEVDNTAFFYSILLSQFVFVTKLFSFKIHVYTMFGHNTAHQEIEFVSFSVDSQTRCMSS